MIRRSRALGFLLLAAAALPLAHAQQAVDFSKVQIKTTKLADNFYTLEGQGGTISVLTGPDGVLLVDAQFAPLTDKLVAAVRAVSDRPIRFLVNTSRNSARSYSVATSCASDSIGPNPRRTARRASRHRPRRCRW
jgi:hypothetical protein